MVYKRFRIQVILRVIFFSLLLVLFVFMLLRTQLYAALIILGLLIVYQIYSLLRFVEKTNRDLARFFTSIKYSDFSQSFKADGIGSSFDELKLAFNEVMNAFRTTRAEKEEHFRYLQTVVQHVGMGLVAYQPNGDVELINTEAKRLFRVPRLKNVKALESLSPRLVETLLKIKSKQKALVKVDIGDELLHLALYATEFKLRGETFTLVSVQNIHGELEEKEMEAWQKLIRVLTHEIMNSITPISSLASTINEMILESCALSEDDQNIDEESLTDIREAVQTIQKRSQGLLHFVDAYRNLTLIQKPSFQIFPIRELFLRIEKLMQASLKEKAVQFTAGVEPESLELTADPELIEQVLINLLLNALQAVQGREDSAIELGARLDGRGRIIIEVKDNGSGISQENREKIFIPFFSTREGGSGIGLSLSRQIMRLHNGSITIQSQPDVQTTFTLRF